MPDACRPGSMTVSWLLERAYPTLFVPTSAVTNDQQHTFVIRAHSAQAEWVTVQINGCRRYTSFRDFECIENFTSAKEHAAVSAPLG